MFGYVPTTQAIAYVHVKSNWVAARKWDNVGYPKTLSELQDSARLALSGKGTLMTGSLGSELGQ
jgi:hypothetical protein